jgi:hypothetical protein
MEPEADTVTTAPAAERDAPGAGAPEPKAATASSQPPSRPSRPLPRAPKVGGALEAYEALATAERLPDLVAITQLVVGEAAAARRPEWSFTAKVAAAAEEAKLPRASAETPFGNALKVLESGAEDASERALAAALWAHAVAESPRARAEDEDRLAVDILWLATHTPFDATPLLDRALGDEAGELWAAVADRIRRVDEGRGAALGRGEAIVGCAALASSPSDAAARLRGDLSARMTDPVLARVLAADRPGAAGGELLLAGEAVAPPRGPVVTALLALTGLLFVLHAARLVGRVALAYKKPAEVALSPEGVRVRSRTQMLGRTLREHEDLIVRGGLVRVVREVRYPRAAFYAGLLALAVGSYIGVRSFVDGVRAASPSLLLAGLVIVALGIAADFVLGSLLPGARGRCRLAFVPRKGRVLCVADVDAERADQVIARALEGAV